MYQISECEFLLLRYSQSPIIRNNKFVESGVKTIKQTNKRNNKNLTIISEFTETKIMWKFHEIQSRRGLRGVVGLWCLTPVYATNKTDRHDITEIFLKVALNTINQTKPKLINPGIIKHFIYLYTIPCAAEKKQSL